MRLIILLILVNTVYAKHDDRCKTRDKFVKAYEFISRLKNVELKKDEIINFATSLATPCNKTFERFENVYDMTEKTDLSVKTSIILSVRIARDKNIKINDLKSIFKFLIKPQGPDLPYASAMKYAEEFAKTGKNAEDHLINVFNFCLKTKSINKTREKCIKLAYDVASLDLPKDNIFEKAFNYFSSNKVFNYNSQKSLEMAFRVVKLGPDSFEDFKALFDFAMKKRGVNLSRDSALELALNVVENAEKKEKKK